MCATRKLLAAAILLAVFYSNVCAKQTPDERDQKCREKALKEVIGSGLLEKDLNNSNLFQSKWNEQNKCSNTIPGGVREHAAALSLFAKNEDDTQFFNTTGDMLVNGSTYDNSFPFKSLHFLLMDALELLSQNVCESKYILTDEKITAEKGSLVRFRTFQTVYPDTKSLDQDLESMTVFNITTCFFANLGGIDCVRNKNTAVLSPAEQFIVNGKHKKIYEDSDYTEIVLTHKKVFSYKDCKSTSGSPADVSTQWLVSLLAALSLFFFHC